MVDTIIGAPRLPRHLPRRLRISLWDFSWYTMCAEGEPFRDLDARFGEARDRGYNTIRICGLPLVLFGDGVPADRRLGIENLGGEVGQRTRWYNCRGGVRVDGRRHLLELFRQAREHGFFVILSSWEYQQSTAFFDSPRIFEELQAIPLERRFLGLAAALSREVDFLEANGVADRIAYVELHNEIDLAGTRLGAGDGPGTQSARVDEALEAFTRRHPDVLVTVSLGQTRPEDLWGLPGCMQVAHFHLYVYGVLGRLLSEAGLHDPDRFPTPFARSLLRKGAPPFTAWQPSAPWKLQATAVGRPLLYLHDWADPDRWDRYLYEHYETQRAAMRDAIRVALASYAGFARAHDIPVVLGEGYVGYTPLWSTFEEGPVGKDLCEYAVALCQELGFWGAILCSNAAPHHPFWHDAAWQRYLNEQGALEG